MWEQKGRQIGKREQVLTTLNVSRHIIHHTNNSKPIHYYPHLADKEVRAQNNFPRSQRY